MVLIDRNAVGNYIFADENRREINPYQRINTVHSDWARLCVIGQGRRKVAIFLLTDKESIEKLSNGLK